MIARGWRDSIRAPILPDLIIPVSFFRPGILSLTPFFAKPPWHLSTVCATTAAVTIAGPTASTKPNRFHDDGEPPSSAGKPILAAIDGQGFDHVVVVVTRWFGGVKLGVGGLIRAYGSTAAQCLQQPARQPIVHVTRMTLRCDFAQWSLLAGRIRERDITIENITYGALAVEAILAVPSGQESELAHLVADATQGRGSFVALPENCP